MLHALLRRKLELSTPDPDRLEDALTSSVLGTLAMVERWDLLARCFGIPCPLPGEVCGQWFWPRLKFAEPDAVFLLSGRLVVVEAKLRSGRHDRVVQEEGEISDQLHRQWKSLADESCRAACPADLRELSEGCALKLVYLIDGRRIGRASRELAESRRHLPAGVDLALRTWQDVYRVIAASGDRSRPWASAILDLLDRLGLNAYMGDWRARDIARSNLLNTWRAPSGPVYQWASLVRHNQGAITSAAAHLASGSRRMDLKCLADLMASGQALGRWRVAGDCNQRFGIAAVRGISALRNFRAQSLPAEHLGRSGLLQTAAKLAGDRADSLLRISFT